jgi:hypothetical protein
MSGGSIDPIMKLRSTHSIAPSMPVLGPDLWFRARRSDRARRRPGGREAEGTPVAADSASVKARTGRRCAHRRAHRNSFARTTGEPRDVQSAITRPTRPPPHDRRPPVRS